MMSNDAQWREAKNGGAIWFFPFFFEWKTRMWHTMCLKLVKREKDKTRKVERAILYGLWFYNTKGWPKGSACVQHMATVCIHWKSQHIHRRVTTHLSRCVHREQCNEPSRSWVYPTNKIYITIEGFSISLFSPFFVDFVNPTTAIYITLETRQMTR